MMRFILSMIMVMAATQAAHGETLILRGYQLPDGAITTLYGGDVVDPYFAIRALLLAEDGGLAIHAPARAFILWMLQRQREDGLFERYCAKPGEQWQTCAAADADDALLAMWLELLAIVPPPRGYEKQWRESAFKANRQLALLKNPQTGIYHISATLPVGLFMDNLEIYQAFRRIGRHTEAKQLAQAIETVFWREEKQNYAASTQERTESAFYPDRVAQIYPLLFNYKKAGRDNAAFMRAWLAENRADWPSNTPADYPWGLAAVAALKAGVQNAAYCWQVRAIPFRYGKQWNVLEEASLQYVEQRLKKMPPTVAIACTEEGA